MPKKPTGGTHFTEFSLVQINSVPLPKSKPTETYSRTFHGLSRTTFIFKHLQGLKFVPLKVKYFQGQGGILRHYVQLPERTWYTGCILLRPNSYAEAKLNQVLSLYLSLKNIIFTISSPSNPGHLVPCNSDNVGTILSSQILNMKLTSIILLLICYFIMFN